MKYGFVIALLSLLLFGVVGHLFMEEGNSLPFKAGEKAFERYLKRSTN